MKQSRHSVNHCFFEGATKSEAEIIAATYFWRQKSCERRANDLSTQIKILNDRPTQIKDTKQSADSE